MVRSKIFLDSSVLITATLSSSGGSFYILNTLQESYTFYVNEYVLDEVTRIFKTKFADKPHLYTYYLLLLGRLHLQVVDDPTQQQLKRWSKVIDVTDTPILVSALKHCEYLLTLDNDFFQPKVLQAIQTYALTILKPQQLIHSLR